MTGQNGHGGRSIASIQGRRSAGGYPMEPSSVHGIYLSAVVTAKEP